MPPTTPGVPAYRFGSFELDARTGELRKLGIRVKLQDQPREILLLLLRNAGETVTREQIQKHLWPDNTFVDFDNAINSAVRKLRGALGDNADSPRFVETLARRGYRFVAPLSTGGAGALEPRATAVSIPPRQRAWRLAAVSILLLGLATLAMDRLFTGTVRQESDIRVVPLTANVGQELQPSFSPDGSRVAYAWNGPGGKNFAIYVKLIGAGDPVRITQDLARDFSPAWSPDGRWIAALRDLGSEAAVLLVPASGGPHREVARIVKAPPGYENCVSSDLPRVCGQIYWGTLLAWSADGKYLFTSAYHTPDAPQAIVRISVETSEQQPITSQPSTIAGDFGPAISPDGRELAFVRVKSAKTADLYVASLSQGLSITGAPQQITFDDADIESLAWTRDGRELIFSSDRRGRHELWRVPLSGHREPVRLHAMGEDATDLAIAPNGVRLVYSQGTYHGSIWKTPIEGGRAGPPIQVTATTARDKFSQFSPDGRRIAFQSKRSGVDEIWVCDADGSNAVQLTSFQKGMSGTPRWSPDGKTIAFDSNVTGNWDIWLIGAEGGSPRRLTTNPAADFIPSWSRDGQLIYFASSRSGSSNIWKIRQDGTSETQVTYGDSSSAVESADRKFLYYKKGIGEEGELWRMPVGGGEATKVLERVAGRLYTITEKGIYFALGVPVPELRYLDFRTGSVRAIATLSSFAQADVSPDERWVEYPQAGTSSTNLMLVENLR
jgi:Tol biopolymer transport system component/DNA-binding winged helix-turn-helix (wHTH) protein